MYIEKYNCIVCGEENELQIKTKNRENAKDNHTILEKNEDGTYNIAVDSKCLECGLTQRINVTIRIDR
jgi:hypothetical protein